MAIEDAVSLATLLPRDTEMSDIPARRIPGEFNADSEHARANHGYIVMEVMQVMSKCFDHNEIKASGGRLESLLSS